MDISPSKSIKRVLEYILAGTVSSAMTIALGSHLAERVVIMATAIILALAILSLMQILENSQSDSMDLSLTKEAVRQVIQEEKSAVPNESIDELE